MKDLAVAEELRRIDPDISILFCSYAQGIKVLDRSMWHFLDLHLPVNNPFFETLVRAGRLIHAYRPTIVVSHEEFGVLPAARLFNKPALFITHWFLEPEHFLMQSLVCADHILFIEESGCFPVPPYLVGKVTFIGPILRSFNYTPQDRPRARRELKISDATKVILVFSGMWSEAVAPSFQLILSAFNLLSYPDKLLIWIAGRDAQQLQKKVGNIDNIIVKEVDWEIDRLMVATDLGITKSSYTTVLELDALGIPSIALLHGHNPVDETYAKRRKNVTPLDLNSLSPETLAQTIENLLRHTPHAPDTSYINNLVEGRKRAAQFIKEFMHTFCDGI